MDQGTRWAGGRLRAGQNKQRREWTQTALETRGAVRTPAEAAEPHRLWETTGTDAQLARWMRLVKKNGACCTRMTERATTSTSPTTPPTWMIASTLLSSGTSLDSGGPRSEGVK